jgi:hypothetical protein
MKNDYIQRDPFFKIVNNCSNLSKKTRMTSKTSHQSNQNFALQTRISICLLYYLKFSKLNIKMPLDFHPVCLWPFGIMSVFITKIQRSNVPVNYFKNLYFLWT